MIVVASATVGIGIALCRDPQNGNNQLQEQNVQNDNHNPVIANELSNENRNDEMNQNQAENAQESENNLISIAESNKNNLTANNIILNADRNLNLKAGGDLVSALKKFVLQKHFQDFKLRIKDKIAQEALKKMTRFLC